MCFRLISTFQRCGHQDTIAHVQFCRDALDNFPSVQCHLGPGDLCTPAYDIHAYCPSCALNHTVVTPTGHLREGSKSINIIFQVPNSEKAKSFEHVATMKKTTDTPLEWKEVGGPATLGTSAGGWDVDATAGDDWGSGDAAGGADWGSGADVAAGGNWDKSTDESKDEPSASPFDTGNGAPSTAATEFDGGADGAASGDWGNGDGQWGGEKEQAKDTFGSKMEWGGEKEQAKNVFGGKQEWGVELSW